MLNSGVRIGDNWLNIQLFSCTCDRQPPVGKDAIITLGMRYNSRAKLGMREELERNGFNDLASKPAAYLIRQWHGLSGLAVNPYDFGKTVGGGVVRIGAGVDFIVDHKAGATRIGYIAIDS